MRDVSFETQTGLGELYGLVGLVSALLVWRLSIPPGVLATLSIIHNIRRKGIFFAWLPRTTAQSYCRAGLLALGLALTVVTFYETWRYLQLLELVAGDPSSLDDGMFERVLERVATLRRETIHIGFVAAGLFVSEAIVNGVPFRQAVENDVPRYAHTFVMDGGTSAGEVWERRIELLRCKVVRKRLPSCIIERLDSVETSQQWRRNWADWHQLVHAYTVGTSESCYPTN